MTLQTADSDRAACADGAGKATDPLWQTSTATLHCTMMDCLVRISTSLLASFTIQTSQVEGRVNSEQLEFRVCNDNTIL